MKVSCAEIWVVPGVDDEETGATAGLGRAEDEDRVRLRLTTETAVAGLNSCKNDNLMQNRSS